MIEAAYNLPIDDADLTTTTVSIGNLQTIAFEHIDRLLDSIQTSQVLQSGVSDADYRQAEGYQLRVNTSARQAVDKLKHKCQVLLEAFPILEPQLFAVRADLPGLLLKTAEGIYHKYRQIVADLHPVLYSPTDRQSECEILVSHSGLEVTITGGQEYRRATNRAQYVTGVSELIARLRDAELTPTIDELIAIEIAHHFLNEGVPVLQPVKPWGNPGFRDVQTYMSITDPGPGHLQGTVKDNSLMHGVIVHIEHLERGVRIPRDVIEPYRIPAPHIIPIVRLHVGTVAPTSSYVGRPMFEDSIQNSLVKTVHTNGAACSALFMDGLTECKIAIEGMTASEAISFMRALAGNIRRDRYSQTLSAAFNLNTPILDDRPETMQASGEAQLVTDPYEIGLLGVILTVEGGFDKVTWDGNADTYPSKCIIEQLTHQQALMLVHRAHERGLLTYFSAGFRFHHLPQAVITGVDGVGVGGAQILRYMDPENGNHGAFKLENIREITRIRDEASRSVLGQGALLLCRLDQMFAEKSITSVENNYRRAVVKALVEQDTEAVERLLHELQHVMVIPPDDIHPVLARAARLLRADTRSLAFSNFAPGEWRALMFDIQVALRHGDVALCHTLLESTLSPSSHTEG